LLPPLIITEAEAREAIERLEAACEAAEAAGSQTEARV
jgi:acetylornithine/succinyldiaminopimelate/putrescine aminotransferase